MDAEFVHTTPPDDSFIQAISIAPLAVHYTIQRRSRHNTDTVP